MEVRGRKSASRTELWCDGWQLVYEGGAAPSGARAELPNPNPALLPGAKAARVGERTEVKYNGWLTVLRGDTITSSPTKPTGVPDGHHHYILRRP